MRSPLSLILLPIALTVACGDKASPDSISNGGSAGAASGQMSSGAPTSGASHAGAGAASEGGGRAGDEPMAGNGATAGQAGALAGASGGGNGNGNGGSSNGGSGNGGSDNGGNSSGGSNGSGRGCTRELLSTTTDAYFKALAAHSAATLPLAENVKFTENGKASNFGDAGLWKTAGTLKYAQSAFDTEMCMSASEAVVPDGSTDVPIAVRLKLEDQKLTEIETIVARAADYPATKADTEALAASDAVVKWEETVPVGQRAKRGELTGWMEKYFKQFPAGVCNTTSDCKRMENGGGSFVCSQGASCSAGAGSGQPVLTPRLVLADVETGLGVGFTIFTGGYTDMHMFKMQGGKVSAVSAILATSKSSGWE